MGKTFKLTQRGHLLCDKLHQYYDNMIEETTKIINDKDENAKKNDIYNLLYDLQLSLGKVQIMLYQNF